VEMALVPLSEATPRHTLWLSNLNLTVPKNPHAARLRLLPLCPPVPAP